MRPIRLELEGFASFRQPTEVRFEDTELFVLMGPTGSGKSTVIDAMVFALYGSVPRYADRRLVAPVISQGKVEAKVALDFEVDGAFYRAVRIVRRTPTGGASTKEARLENASGEVLAGTAGELDRVIEEQVIGLPFDHFTRCVVLPQGEFAEFLRTKPSDRQDLLVKLLALDLFGTIGAQARARAGEEQNRATLLERRLKEELSGATPEAVEQAKARVTDLEALQARIEKAKPQLQALEEAINEAKEAEKEAKRLRRLVAAIEVPDSVAELSERISAAEKEAAATQVAFEEAVEAREQAQQQLEDLPARSELEALQERRAGREELAEKLGATEAALKECEEKLVEAEAAEKKIAAEREEAVNRLEAIRREHSAADLARHLEPGESCPVCLRTVDAVPERDVPEDLDAAREALNDLDAKLREARASTQKQDREKASASSQVDSQRQALSELDEELADAPEPEAIEAKLGEVTAAEEALATARSSEKATREAQAKAKKALEATGKEKRDAWSRFDEARDTVAELDAPSPDRDRLAESWEALAEWAASQERTRAEAAAEAAKIVKKKDDQRTELIEGLRTSCAEVEVDASQREPGEACAEALGTARSEHERLKEAAETAEKVAKERDKAVRRAGVARSLGQHLSARNFEAWLLSRALHHLVAGATSILRDLSSGAYSLDLAEDNTFLVIDHHNADERRSAKTLSGGETFLASLSLALALAEHVSQLASRGSARLDALFLDEGFGTLDPETLDVVATAIEELGAKGRMVGLVTHVRELAERMPVQYRVKKVGNVSSVERVAA